MGEAAGTLTDVKVNGVLAGDGNWSLNASGEIVKATASVGSLDPVLRVLDASAEYKIASKTLNATLQAKDVPLETVVAAVEAQRSSSEEEADRLKTAKGDLSGTVNVVRTGDGAVSVEASDLRGAALRYGEVEYGTLTAASVVRNEGRWTLGGVDLKGSAGKFALSGTYAENGALDLRASGDSVRLAAFSPFAADLAQVTGTARFALIGQGTIREPIVSGTAAVEGLFAGPTVDALSIGIDRLAIRDGLSEVAGSLRYGPRFGGLYDATVGWNYRKTIDDATLQAKVDLGTLDATNGKPTVGSVPLTEIPFLKDYLDKRGNGGTLTGSLAATGTVMKPVLSGGLQLLADRLGIAIPGDRDRPVQKVDDVLRDVNVALGFDAHNAPVLNASARFDRGGTMNAHLGLGDTGGEDLRTTLSKARDWKVLPVTGSLKLDKANIQQTVAGGTTKAILDGDISVSGSAVAPAIKGAVVASNFSTTLPSLEGSSSDTGPPLFDPTFDLTIALAQAGLFKTATAELYLTGDVTVAGSLSNPRADAEFLTDRGQIRLPGGIVRVVKGGQISFDYRNPLAGGTPPSATIDLQGRSQITLARSGQALGQGSQRYDITLDMRGDLLRENGLQFDATADPPELDKDEILNALGGNQYLQGITEGGSSTERSLRGAFAGFALPGLLDNVTNPLAQIAGLEYVTLDYNQYDQATVNYGRALGHYFSFRGRQQVGSPTPGYRSIYDLRVVFSPPKLGRFSITAGTDQDRPFKTSVEYGTRFGQGGEGKGRAKHVLFPSKPGTGWTPPSP